MTPSRIRAAEAVRAWMGAPDAARSVDAARARRRSRVLDLAARGERPSAIAEAVGCSRETAAGIIRAARHRRPQ